MLSSMDTWLKLWNMNEEISSMESNPVRQYNQNSVYVLNSIFKSNTVTLNPNSASNHSSQAYLTPCHSVPIFSTVISTSSPGFSHRGGFIAMPTPAGVPVRMMLFAKRVLPWLQNSTIWATLKMRSLVEPVCRSSLFTLVEIPRTCGSGMIYIISRVISLYP